MFLAHTGYRRCRKGNDQRGISMVGAGTEPVLMEGAWDSLGPAAGTHRKDWSQGSSGGWRGGLFHTKQNESCFRTWRVLVAVPCPRGDCPCLRIESRKGMVWRLCNCPASMEDTQEELAWTCHHIEAQTHREWVENILGDRACPFHMSHTGSAKTLKWSLPGTWSTLSERSDAPCWSSSRRDTGCTPILKRRPPPRRSSQHYRRCSHP